MEKGKRKSLIFPGERVTACNSSFVQTSRNPVVVMSSSWWQKNKTKKMMQMCISFSPQIAGARWLYNRWHVYPLQCRVDTQRHIPVECLQSASNMFCNTRSSWRRQEAASESSNRNNHSTYRRKYYTQIEQKTIIFCFHPVWMQYARNARHQIIFRVCECRSDLKHFYVSFAWWKFSFWAGVHPPNSRPHRYPYNQCIVGALR